MIMGMIPAHLCLCLSMNLLRVPVSHTITHSEITIPLGLLTKFKVFSFMQNLTFH